MKPVSERRPTWCSSHARRNIAIPSGPSGQKPNGGRDIDATAPPMRPIKSDMTVTERATLVRFMEQW